MVGLAGTILTSLNGVVGSGIFALPALLFAAAGTFSPIAILIFACLYGSVFAVIAALIVMWRRGDAGLRESMGARWLIIIPVALGYIAWLMSQLSLVSVLYMAIMVGIGFAFYFASRGVAVRQDDIDLPETRAV